MIQNETFEQKPLLKTDDYLLTKPQPFVAEEAYRALRTNVMFALPGCECKCIGVTSAVPGDGKSTTAANLAISLAQIGKKVLLVDCDMRLPTVASKFGMQMVPGLSDLLVGQAKIADVIRQNEELDFHILPAGNIPPDPTGLLESQQLDELCHLLRGNYEYVIVDLPPVGAVADAMILSKHIDGYLLVVRERKTAHREVAEMMRQIEIADAKIIGFVLTGADMGTTKHYKYEYGNKNQSSNNTKCAKRRWRFW